MANRQWRIVKFPEEWLPRQGRETSRHLRLRIEPLEARRLLAGLDDGSFNLSVYVDPESARAGESAADFRAIGSVVQLDLKRELSGGAAAEVPDQSSDTIDRDDLVDKVQAQVDGAASRWQTIPPSLVDRGIAAEQERLRGENAALDAELERLLDHMSREELR